MLGECFKNNAMKYIATSLPSDWFLVHAVVTGPSDWKGPTSGKKFVHCWVESKDSIFDYTDLDSPARYRRDYWYQEMQPQFVVRLTQQETILRINHSGHYGHWRQHPEHIRFSPMPQENAEHRRNNP